MLPNMFTNDFGNQVQRFVTLINAKTNQFEVMVERIDGLCFSPRDGNPCVIFMVSAWVSGFLSYLWIK